MSLGRVFSKHLITHWEEVISLLCYLFRLINFFTFQVGVTGSGKGMTEVALKSKHKFEIKDDDGQ